jgi:guanylate kinase
MTRELRSGEMDKNPITDAELDDMERRGKLLVVNDLYGVRYATPRKPIITAFREGKFPLLDWPIDRIEIMQTAFPSRLFKVYVEPPSVEILKQRLADGRDPELQRMAAAVEELGSLASGTYDNVLDLKVVSREGEAEIIAKLIYNSYLHSMGL